jgi:hypothetical protein
MTLEQAKEVIAKQQGYPSWRELYDWVCRDGQYPAVVGQLIEAAMTEAHELSTKQSTICAT